MIYFSLALLGVSAFFLGKTWAEIKIAERIKDLKAYETAYLELQVWLVGMKGLEKNELFTEAAIIRAYSRLPNGTDLLHTKWSIQKATEKSSPI